MAYKQEQPVRNVGLRGVGGVLGSQQVTLEDLAGAGMLVSSPQVMRDFGFSHAHLAGRNETVNSLAACAAKEAMADAQVSAAEIDVVIWASALPANHVVAAPAEMSNSQQALLAQFRYAGGQLQEEFGLEQAQLLAVTQQGCCTMFTAMRIARALMLADENVRHVLCVGADVLPTGSPREIMYNVISDAACAAVLSADAPHQRWIGYRQVSKGYYWDTVAREKEIIAAYFPTARAVIQDLLEEQGLRPQDINIIVPTGVNRESWKILLRLTGIDPTKLYDGGLSFGHTILADNLLFLKQLRRDNVLHPGDRLLLYTYGFGSSWCALLLEH